MHAMPNHEPNFKKKKGISTVCPSETGLVVEQTDVLLNEGDAELLRRLKDGLVVLAAARRSNVLGTRLGNAVNIVREGELDTMLV